MARILVLTVTHPPEDARIRHREIDALLEGGHTVTYAAPFGAWGGARTAPATGLRQLEVPRAAGGPHRRLVPVLAAARLALHEAPRHDLVLVHDPELLAVLAVLAAAGRVRRGPRPVLVWDVHEDLVGQLQMVRLPSPLRRIVALVLRGMELTAERMFRLLLAETAYRDRFRRAHPVVPNSVRVPATPPVPAEEKPRVVYLGALTRARGSDQVIAIARALPDVTVEVLGNARPDVDAELRAASVELPNLDYRGFVPNSQALGRLPGALAGLCLLADQPNYAHSQPTKVMEYMAHGVPVITTPNAASRAMVTEAEAGAVIGFGDVEAAVDAVTRWDADRELQGRLGRNGYLAARERHNWDIDGDRFARTLGEWTRDS